MGRLDRVGRVIVAEGGSCPSLERLGNGDLLVAYRDDTHSKSCVSVTRSTDCGRTWRKEHTFAYGAAADRERRSDSTATTAWRSSPTVPSCCRTTSTAPATAASTTAPSVCAGRWTRAMTWSEPETVIPGPGAAAGWAAACSYGKIRTLQDGTVIFPIIGRREG